MCASACARINSMSYDIALRITWLTQSNHTITFILSSEDDGNDVTVQVMVMVLSVINTSPETSISLCKNKRDSCL